MGLYLVLKNERPNPFIDFPTDSRRSKINSAVKTLKETKNDREEANRRMTQKQNLFKGQQTKKTIPPNRHGKAPLIRKGEWRIALGLC